MGSQRQNAIAVVCSYQPVLARRLSCKYESSDGANKHGFSMKQKIFKSSRCSNDVLKAKNRNSKSIEVLKNAIVH